MFTTYIEEIPVREKNKRGRQKKTLVLWKYVSGRKMKYAFSGQIKRDLDVVAR